METKTAASGFAALSQEKRIELMRVLATRGEVGMSAGHLATALEQAPSTLSFHLSALEQAGLVHSTRKGRQVIYTVRLSGLRSLFGFLTETCCNGRPDLCGDLARLIPDDVDEVRAMTPAFNVMFLCTHNSARSIMAEAIVEKISNGKFHAYSAGSDPSPAPSAEVIDRLRVFGHDVSNLKSKSWLEFIGPNAPRMDFVITLCDTLDGQVCPDFGKTVVTAAWPFPDPAKFHGSDIERATMINSLYGMMRRRLEAFISLPYASLDSLALKARLDELGDGSKYAG